MVKVLRFDAPRCVDRLMAHAMYGFPFALIPYSARLRRGRKSHDHTVLLTSLYKKSYKMLANPWHVFTHKSAAVLMSTRKALPKRSPQVSPIMTRRE